MNRGLPIRFADNRLYHRIFAPAGRQLIMAQRKTKKLFSEVRYGLGIIVGNKMIVPISSIIIPRDDDGKVSIKSTKLKGMKDHVIVSTSHGFSQVIKLSIGKPSIS